MSDTARPNYVPEFRDLDTRRLGPRREPYNEPAVPMSSREARAVGAVRPSTIDPGGLEQQMLGVIRDYGPVSLSGICDTLTLGGVETDWNACRARLASLASRALIVRAASRDKAWVLAPGRRTETTEPEPEQVTTYLGNTSRTLPRQGPDTELAKHWQSSEITGLHSGEKPIDITSLADDPPADPPEPVPGFSDRWVTPEGATVGFLRRDGDQVTGEYQAHVCRAGIQFEDGTPIPPEVLAAMLPVLKRVQVALFEGDTKRE